MSEGFFERPAPQPEPAPPEAPPWTGPPHGVLPGVAALELLLASNKRAAVYIGRCSVYVTGLELEVRVLVRGDDLDPSLNGVYHRPGGGSTYEQMLRFGIELSDGRKATNVGGAWPGTDQPQGPVLRGMGGGGGGGSWRQDFWVWPLPPPGSVVLVCEWPAAGLALIRQEVDSQILLDAAARARSLFPDEPTSHPGGTWASYGIAFDAQAPRQSRPLAQKRHLSFVADPAMRPWPPLRSTTASEQQSKSPPRTWRWELTSLRAL